MNKKHKYSKIKIATSKEINDAGFNSIILQIEPGCNNEYIIEYIDKRHLDRENKEEYVKMVNNFGAGKR